MSKSVMQMCADEIAGYLKRIADLEAKLAESEEEIKIVREQNKRVLEKLDLIVRSNQDLEKQLAEKDTQIQSQKKNLEFFYDVFNNSEPYQTFSDINQAKTDFAIEQLEWVRGIMMFHPPADNEIELIKSFLIAIQNKIQELRGQE